MFNHSQDSAQKSELHNKPWFAAECTILMIAWLASTCALIVMLLLDVRHTEQFSNMRYVLQVVYVLVLLWYLSRSGPSQSLLPEIPQLLLPRWKYGPHIPVVGVVLVLALTLFSDLGTPVVLLLLIIGTIWILVVWRRQIELRVVLLGLMIAVIAFLGGLPFISNNFIGNTYIRVQLKNGTFF